MKFKEVCFACMGRMRKLHILLLLLMMLQVSSNTDTHMQHECCLVCNVFQSVANMVPATEGPQRISVVAELPCCGGLIGHTLHRAFPDSII